MADKMIYNHEALLRYLLYGALLLVILIGMNMTSYLFNMIFISLILTMIGAPIYYYLKKRGFSDIGAVSSVMAIYGATILAFLLLIVYSLNVFIGNIGKYSELFYERIADLYLFLSDFGINLPSLADFEPDWGSISKYVLHFAGDTSSLMMNAFFIFVITTFLFLEIPVMPKRIKKVFGNGEETDSKYMEMCNSMIKWLVVKTKTNVVLGAAFGGMLYVLGIDLAIFLGVLAFFVSQSGCPLPLRHETAMRRDPRVRLSRLMPQEEPSPPCQATNGLLSRLLCFLPYLPFLRRFARPCPISEGRAGRVPLRADPRSVRISPL